MRVTEIFETVLRAILFISSITCGACQLLFMNKLEQSEKKV